MITNHLLEATYQVQRELDAESGHDIAEYNRLADKIVRDMEKEYGIKFIYGAPSIKPTTSNLE